MKNIRLNQRNNLTNQKCNLPSLSPANIEKIRDGLYSGKPLLGKEGLLSDLIKGDILARRNGRTFI